MGGPYLKSAPAAVLTITCSLVQIVVPADQIGTGVATGTGSRQGLAVAPMMDSLLAPTAMPSNLGGRGCAMRKGSRLGPAVALMMMCPLVQAAVLADLGARSRGTI